jgi:hypothetical protein
MMKEMIGRKSALWLAAAISVLAVAAPAANGATDEQPCNGSPLLCGKTLDQVVLPGTHNSMSNEEYNWALPNQHYSIPTQLDMGIRAFLIDTHYGKPGTGGSGVANWNNGTDGDPHEHGATVYLCHELCMLGATGFTAELTKVRDYLAAHPREVITFMIENYVDPQDIAKSFTDSGLIAFVYTGSTDAYPTLSEMIDSNQRVVVFSEGNTGSVSWFHNGYDGAIQETPYNFLNDETGTPLTPRQGMDLLTEQSTLDSTCRPNRGDTTGALFLMNHWVNGQIDSDKTGGNQNVIPDPEVARVLNQRAVLVARARACESRRGKLPNIVAVDDFGDGDLITAVRELNGLTRPVLSVRRPGKRVVKAGRKATFGLRISNTGEEDATAVRICVAVPRRLAIKPGCRKVTIAQATTKTVKLRVRTRRKARGSGKVTFTVTGAGDRVVTSTRIKLKPVKKKKRPRHHRH